MFVERLTVEHTGSGSLSALAGVGCHHYGERIAMQDSEHLWKTSLVSCHLHIGTQCAAEQLFANEKISKYYVE